VGEARVKRLVVAIAVRTLVNYRLKRRDANTKIKTPNTRKTSKTNIPMPNIRTPLQSIPLTPRL
jgi:hypothetical protein